MHTPEEIIMDQVHFVDAGAATDAATLNSDDAVVEGGVKRREGDIPTPPPPQEAEVLHNYHAATAGGGSPKTGGNTHARRQHYRKRALSSATNGTLDTNASMNRNVTSDNNNAFSGLSFMHNSAIGSNMMSSGGDHSIVSFGLNFNFDNTSSPSNSDSGEGGEINQKKADVNDGSDDKKPAAKPSAMTAPNNKDTSGGSNKGKHSKERSSNHHKHSNKTSRKTSPSGTTGEDGRGSDPNSSDSSMNNDSGGSASGGDSNSGSGSGGDGSGGSGWKSTISSLTTSSNQEWMVRNDSAAAAMAAREAQAVANKATGDAKMSPEGMETGVYCMGEPLFVSFQ